MPPASVARFGPAYVDRGETHVQFFNRPRQDAREGLLSSLALGDLVVRDVSVRATRLDPGKFGSGILGQAILGHAPWEIDWDRGTVTLGATPWPDAPDVIVVPLRRTWAWDVVTVQVDWHTVDMILDTGTLIVGDPGGHREGRGALGARGGSEEESHGEADLRRHRARGPAAGPHRFPVGSPQLAGLRAARARRPQPLPDPGRSGDAACPSSPRRHVGERAAAHRSLALDAHLPLSGLHPGARRAIGNDARPWVLLRRRSSAPRRALAGLPGGGPGRLAFAHGVRGASPQ